MLKSEFTELFFPLSYPCQLCALLLLLALLYDEAVASTTSFTLDTKCLLNQCREDE